MCVPVYISCACILQGVVGTMAGTLWYINWTERASIRLVSGHGSKVSYSLWPSNDQLPYRRNIGMIYEVGLLASHVKVRRILKW